MIASDHKKIRKKLEKKGWQQGHIEKAVSIIEKAKRKKAYKKSSSRLLIAFFVFLGLGNIMLLLGITPLLIKLPESLIFAMLSVIGLLFGIACDSLVRETEFSKRHYFFAGAFISAIATALILITLWAASLAAALVGEKILINPLLAATFYMCFFSLPHIAYKFRRGVHA